MKGYYHFEVTRRRSQGSSFKYHLQANKIIFDEVNTDELTRLWDLPYDDRPEHLKYGYTTIGTIEFLKTAGLKVHPMFGISCNYPTAMRIYIYLKNALPNNLVLARWSQEWGDPVTLTQKAPEMELPNEEFLVLLQKALTELPKNTFSKQNKQKAIESFMASF